MGKTYGRVRVRCVRELLADELAHPFLLQRGRASCGGVGDAGNDEGHDDGLAWNV